MPHTIYIVLAIFSGVIVLAALAMALITFCKGIQLSRQINELRNMHGRETIFQIPRPSRLNEIRHDLINPITRGDNPGQILNVEYIRDYYSNRIHTEGLPPTYEEVIRTTATLRNN